ncbi:MAG: hypothetical protein LCH30_11975 [Proteobacteria bacterium]|nr:hypothetical protein [Pseudomonadota bacterium]
MTHTNQTFFNPRYVAMFFFAFNAILFVILTKYTLLSFNQAKILPLWPTLGLGILIGGFLGNLFGSSIATQKHWFKTILIGLAMALLALIILTLVLFIYYYSHRETIFVNLQGIKNYFILAGTLFLSLLLTIGLWLIPLTSLAALYFNRYFYPRLIKAASDSKPIQK